MQEPFAHKAPLLLEPPLESKTTQWMEGSDMRRVMAGALAAGTLAIAPGWALADVVTYDFFGSWGAWTSESFEAQALARFVSSGYRCS